MTNADTPYRQQTARDTEIRLRFYALSDVGRSREHNEDTFLIADPAVGEPFSFGDRKAVEYRIGNHGMLFLVADGMGGAASGELASSMAATAILETVRESLSKRAKTDSLSFARALHNGATEANTRVHRFAVENPEHRGMGTTATIAGLLGDELFLAQVGDSRAYLIRGGRPIQLTKDQSLMQRLVDAGEMTQEEAETSERRNIILQALGPEPQVTVDLTRQQLRRGDILLLCSDGLSSIVRAGELAIYAARAATVEELCHRLVARANELGGPDNITVVAVRIEGNGLEPSSDEDYVGHTAFELDTTGQAPGKTDAAAAAAPSSATFRVPAQMHGSQPMSGAISGRRNGEVSETGEDTQSPERRDAAAPFVFLLAASAAVAAVWAIWRLLGRA